MGTTASHSIAAYKEAQNGLEIEWSDHRLSFFHYVWLRDTCYCEQCGETYSSKRFFLPSDIPLHITPKSIELDADSVLHIEWSNDGHKSCYQPAWLRRYCYSDWAREQRRHRVSTWDAKLATRLAWHDYAGVVDKPEEKLKLLCKLRDYGLVLLKNTPSGANDLETIADLIGGVTAATYAAVFDLTPKSPLRVLGNTNHRVPPHTDEAYRYTPPGISVLQCLVRAASGGESAFVDGFHLGEILRDRYPREFDLLSHVAQPFHRYHPGETDIRARGPVFTLDESGAISGFRFHTRAAAPLDVPSDLVEPLYAANQRLCELMLSPENQLNLTLNPGEVVLFDNHRVMHSRRSFSGDRHLRICNVLREDFHESIRLLAEQLGEHQHLDVLMHQGAG